MGPYGGLAPSAFCGVSRTHLGDLIQEHLDDIGQAGADPAREGETDRGQWITQALDPLSVPSG
ncbi:hypothetical protein [Streptomyces sp. NPDC048349]|uniref:hypothetical protein n=1 Tax=Streptomyces sp. NPDC048349 TaxID=3155486 RepID=UPI00342EF939